MKRSVVSGLAVGFALGVVSGACSGTVDVGGFDPADAGSVKDAPSSDAGPGATGPTVEVRLRATQTKVPVLEGTSGQTPLAQTLSIVSLSLYRDAADVSPLVVFDAKDTSADGVTCSVADGADTSIATVPIARLVAGRYTRARIGVSKVTWKVRGRAHTQGLAFDGTFDTVQVLTKGATAEGAVREQGYYKTTFETVGAQPVATEGVQPLPVPPTSGIVTFVNDGARAFYEFPVDLVVDTGVTQNLASVFEVNTYENFRWQDQTTAGYTAGVWDTTGAAFEPVVSFGVNSAKLSFLQR